MTRSWATDGCWGLSFSTHIVVADESVGDDDVVRRRIKAMVRDRFGIHHTTLEIERPGADCEEDVVVIGHQICTAGHDHADGGQP